MSSLGLQTRVRCFCISVIQGLSFSILGIMYGYWAIGLGFLDWNFVFRIHEHVLLAKITVTILHTESMHIYFHSVIT